MKELRLLNYKQTIKLLDYIAQANVSLQATKVELLLPRLEINGIESDIIDFLALFNSLENLFLIFKSNYANKYYTEIISYYRDTLRRLVYYRRYFYIAEKVLYWE